MADETLEEWVQKQDNVVDTLRAQGGFYESNFPVVPNEYTNWLDELKAIVEGCALADLSHHMTAMTLEGPDARRLLKDLCVNDFDDFAIGQGKQAVLCNHDGKIMGDGPVLRLDDDLFHAPGIHATKWIKFNVETGDYDVDIEIEPPTPALDGDPEEFVLQVQGPNSYDLLGELTDADLADIGFYRFETIELAGHEIRAFGHGMSPEAGFEFHGPYEYAADIRQALIDHGEEYGFRQLGSRTYVSNSVRLGWVPPFLKPVYDVPEMQEYREWATAETELEYGKFWASDEDTLESSFSIEGSFYSEDVSDYYLSPVELGYEGLIDFDHDFVGKEALKEEVENPRREKVTLIWDEDDAGKINDSIYGEGENYKFMDNLPRIGWARQAYDRVEVEGDLVGISHSRCYEWDIRTIASLATIDLEYAEPGTEVTLIWGEPDGRSPNPKIPDHTPTEISATVRPAPYVSDHRR